jgi:hypothetical protein
LCGLQSKGRAVAIAVSDRCSLSSVFCGWPGARDAWPHLHQPLRRVRAKESQKRPNRGKGFPQAVKSKAAVDTFDAETVHAIAIAELQHVVGAACLADADKEEAVHKAHFTEAGVAHSLGGREVVPKLLVIPIVLLCCNQCQLRRRTRERRPGRGG